jgi:hypothetical protein
VYRYYAKEEHLTPAKTLRIATQVGLLLHSQGVSDWFARTTLAGIN